MQAREYIMRNEERSFIAALAMGMDACLGDPPNRSHPVAWMGSLIAKCRGLAPASKAGRFLFGGLVSLFGSMGIFFVGRWIESLTDLLPQPMSRGIQAYFLKLVLAMRGLEEAAQEVKEALVQQDLQEARRLLAWHLVSRDTTELDEAGVSAAAIESVAENTTDGVIAPLMYYFVGGLGAAYAYRFSNTVDSMWGYRSKEMEWLGKVPARWDDLLNLVPSRVTAMALLTGGKLMGQDTGHGWRIFCRDRYLTDSPNAGQSMSMTAGLLKVELEKQGQYTLGAGQRKPGPEEIDGAVRLMRWAVGIFLGGISIITLIRTCRKRKR